jgi:hypothetical protein
MKEQLVFGEQPKSTGLSYLLWLFFGLLGAHRIYLGRTGTGIAQLAMCLSVIGIIPLLLWWLIDAFLIPGMARDANLEAIREIEGFSEEEDDNGEPAPRLEYARTMSDPRVDEIRELSRRSRLR